MNTWIFYSIRFNMIQAWKKIISYWDHQRKLVILLDWKKSCWMKFTLKLVKSVDSSIEVQFLKHHHGSSAKNSICVKRSATNRISLMKIILLELKIFEEKIWIKWCDQKHAICFRNILTILRQNFEPCEHKIPFENHAPLLNQVTMNCTELSSNAERNTFWHTLLLHTANYMALLLWNHLMWEIF